jgi:hypothetical protein
MNLKGTTQFVLEVSAVIIILVGSDDFRLYEVRGENARGAEFCDNRSPGVRRSLQMQPDLRAVSLCDFQALSQLSPAETQVARKYIAASVVNLFRFFHLDTANYEFQQYKTWHQINQCLHRDIRHQRHR